MAPSPIRIFALPLTRSSPSRSIPPVIYWHVSQDVKIPTSGKNIQSSSDPSKQVDWKRPSTWPPPSTWPSESVAKASDLWLQWGTKPTYEVAGEKTLQERVTEWKYWTWTKGEGLMDRVEWEEWALKSINPSVKVGEEVVATDDTGVKSVHPTKGSSPRIPLLIPHHPSIDASTVLGELESYLERRIPYHKKYMKQAAALTPIVLPFGLLPLVPNFPFLIAAWRCFSHYRAWKGAEWLLRLVQDGKVEVKVEDKLDEALRPVRSEIIEGGRTGSGPVEGGDHAPDETSTPKGLIMQGEGKQESEVEEENATLQTRHILEEGTTTSESSTGRQQATKSTQTASAGSTGVPDPKDQEVAPDATGTPASQIYHPKTSDRSSTTSESTEGEAEEEARLTMENIPRLKEMFGLRASEIVDLTRAVMQIKDKADRAIKEEQK